MPSIRSIPSTRNSAPSASSLVSCRRADDGGSAPSTGISVSAIGPDRDPRAQIQPFAFDHVAAFVTSQGAAARADFDQPEPPKITFDLDKVIAVGDRQRAADLVLRRCAALGQ